MNTTRSLIAILLLLITQQGFSQNDSCGLRISLLTCSPGEELYSTFGHTAIRVTDSTRGNDIVFNYGTFDDSDPVQFYMDFTRGLMRYALSAYDYADFLTEYRMQQRGVIEQNLQLDCAAKKKLFNALLTNLEEGNRYYDYYFHKDNCTTRARDIIAANAGGAVHYKNILPAESVTYRNLLYQYLNKGGQYWSKLGIDILLGSNLDKKITNQQAMFLPDYLMKGFDSATVNGHPLVKATSTALAIGAPIGPATAVTPFMVFAVIALIIGLATISRSEAARKLLAVFDVVFFMLLGLLGVLLLVLWIIRVDDVCRNNFNCWWALPSHLVVAFVLHRKKSWVQKYFRFTFFSALLLLLAWFFIPQQLNLAILPVLVMILLRSYSRSIKRVR